MNNNETVREVCAEISSYGENCPYFDEDGFLNLKPLANRILSAYEREMAAKDAEINGLHDKYRGCEPCWSEAK